MTYNYICINILLVFHMNNTVIVRISNFYRNRWGIYDIILLTNFSIRRVVNVTYKILNSTKTRKQED